MRSIALGLVLVCGCRTPPLEPRDLAVADFSTRADLSHRDLSYVDLSRTNDLALCPPPEVPSRQQVHFRVTNAAGSDRFVATVSGGCHYIGVGGLPLLIPLECLCECTELPVVGVHRFIKLPAGGVMESSWEARTYALCSAPFDCSAFGAPDQFALTGSLQPLAPGSYRVTWAAEKQLPADCSFGGGEWICPLTSLPMGIDSSCPSGAPAEGTLTLPPTGDVTVTLTLN